MLTDEKNKSISDQVYQLDSFRKDYTGKLKENSIQPYDLSNPQNIKSRRQPRKWDASDGSCSHWG